MNEIIAIKKNNWYNVIILSNETKQAFILRGRNKPNLKMKEVTIDKAIKTIYKQIKNGFKHVQTAKKSISGLIFILKYLTKDTEHIKQLEQFVNIPLEAFQI